MVGDNCKKFKEISNTLVSDGVCLTVIGTIVKMRPCENSNDQQMRWVGKDIKAVASNQYLKLNFKNALFASSKVKRAFLPTNIRITSNSR